MIEDKISILIPSYNHERYIEQAVTSIWQQSHKNVELIVIDDCSEDTSYSILKSLQKKSPIEMQIEQNSKNQGINYTLKRAFSLANGQYISILASDDYVGGRRYESQLALFGSNPRLKVIYANGIQVPTGNKHQKVHSINVNKLLNKSPREILNFLYTNVNSIFIQTMLVKKELLESFDFLDEKIIADDWLLNTRVFENITSEKEFYYIDEPVFYYRMHSENAHKDVERHVKLMNNYVVNVTPANLKNLAFGNIYYKIGLKLLENDSFSESYSYWKKSMGYGFRISKMKYLRRLLKKYFLRLIS